MIGYLFGFIRTLTDSFLMTSRKKLRKKHSSAKLLYIQSILSLVIGIIAYLIFKPDIVQLAIIFASLTVISVSIGNFLGLYALKFDDFSKLAPLEGMGIIYALILGIVLLKEIPTTYQFLGIILAILGIYLLGNEGKWKYPLALLKQKPVLIFLTAPFWSSLSLVFMKKSLEYASLLSITIFNLILSLPIVYLMYLFFKYISRGKENKKISIFKSGYWLIILILFEPLTLILNVVTVNFIPVVHARVIFALSILLALIFGKMFFQERIKFRVFPVITIFLGIILIILNS